MTNRTHLTRCAPLAIAATLALSSTSLFAQDAAVAPPPPTPVIVVPTVTAPPPAPTIVIPDVTAAAPAPAAPAAQPVRTAPRAAAPARTAPTQTRTAPRPAPVAEPIPAETTITETAPVEIAPIAAAPVAEPILAPEPAPVVEQANGLDNATLFGLGALGVLGLAAVLYAVTRRRRPKTSPEAAAPLIERPIVSRDRIQPTAAVPVGTAAPEFATGLTSQPAVNYSTAAFGTARVAPSTSLSHSGAAVALPREAPTSVEEREALMQRMIAAKPDRANPFRSTRARAKRARLILASLGQDFKDRDPWIDLSQYSSNWPELARRHSAAA
jgi:hypothetical protein